MTGQTFTLKGREYMIDDFGALVQLDAKPYKYDAAYSALYDTPEYTRQNDILQAMRFGFCTAALGSPIRSIIDTGYGNGAFMKFAKKALPTPYVGGIDVTGVPVPAGCIQLETYQFCDVATFWDVLEHIPNLSFLRDLPARVVAISLPNCTAFRGEEWLLNEYRHLKPDEHVRHFDSVSLAKTMGYYGWQRIATGHHEDIVRRPANGVPNILSMAFKRF